MTNFDQCPGDDNQPEKKKTGDRFSFDRTRAFPWRHSGIIQQPDWLLGRCTMYIVIGIARAMNELKIELYYFSANIFLNSIYIEINIDISINITVCTGLVSLP